MKFYVWLLPLNKERLQLFNMRKLGSYARQNGVHGIRELGRIER